VILQALADSEQVTIQRLTNEILRAQLTKVELKLQQFEDLQRILHLEREQVGQLVLYCIVLCAVEGSLQKRKKCRC
jgi:hypothetical protein